MKLLLFATLFFSATVFSQKSIYGLLKKYNNEAIPYISVTELATINNDAILLDARELNEYKVSHLKDAMYIGYDNFQMDIITEKLKNKEEAIVVYCSLGIRSEDIAEKLKKVGYKNVYNLYGGIFEWKNNNLKVIDSTGKETQNVHAFDKTWGKWLKKGIKIYE